MSINMAEFHQVFFEESHEHLENMEQLLLALDLAAPDPEELNTIFRAAHSIKGGSGIFGFTALTSVTHVMENLLDKTRKGTFELSSSVIDLLLRTVDTLSHILNLYREEEPIDWQQVEFAKNQLVAALNGEPFSTQAAKVVETANQEKPAAVSTNSASQEEASFGFFEDEVELGLVDEPEHFGFFDEAYTAKEIRVEDIHSNAADPATHAAVSDDELGYGFFESLTAESFANELDALSTPAKDTQVTDKPINKTLAEQSDAKTTRSKKPPKDSAQLKSQATTDVKREAQTLLASFPTVNTTSATPVASSQVAKKASTSTQDATLRGLCFLNQLN